MKSLFCIDSFRIAYNRPKYLNKFNSRILKKHNQKIILTNLFHYIDYLFSLLPFSLKGYS